jgi:hypothetical protein
MASLVSALPKYRPPAPAGAPAEIACVLEECEQPARARYWQRYKRQGVLHISVHYLCPTCRRDVEVEFPAA